MDVSSQVIQNNQVSELRSSPTRDQMVSPQSQPNKKLARLAWIILIMIVLGGASWWIWDQADFVVVNKSFSTDNVLHVRYFKLSQAGFFMVSRNLGGFPGEYIGMSSLVPKGFYSNVWIELHEKGDETLPAYVLQPNDRVFLKIFHDTDNDSKPRPELDTVVKDIEVNL